MKNQPNRNYKSNADIMTPRPLARAIVRHFDPYGMVCDPCCGDGAFIDAFQELYDATGRIRLIEGYDIAGYADMLDGTDDRKIKTDFLNITKNYWHWIITNPPWEKMRKFLAHSMELAENIVFLVTVNHFFTKARLGDIRRAGFGIREIAYCETPKAFPPSGFQLAAVHIAHRDMGVIRVSEIEWEEE